MSGLETAVIAGLSKAGSALYTATQSEVTYEAAIKLVKTLETFGNKELLHPDFVSSLNEMDIKASVATMQALIDDLKKMENNYNESKSVNVCLTNLHETVEKIEQLLQLIEKKCKEHAESWWSYVYSYPDCTNEMQNLKTLKSQMDNRIDLLTRSVTLELQMRSMQFNNSNENNSNMPETQLTEMTMQSTTIIESTEKEDKDNDNGNDKEKEKEKEKDMNE